MTAARDAGLAVERGEAVAVAANVLARLDPGPIAARMWGATGSFRDSAESLSREVQRAAALSAAGAPVVAPVGGPYEPELLEVCVNARVAQGAAYLAFTGRGGQDALAERLAWLRRGARSSGGHPRSASGSARPGQ
jgi:hypothetical protein